MRTLKLSLIALVGSYAWLSPVQASSYQGYITNIFASGGSILVTLADGSGTSPCAAASTFYLDPSLAYDKAMLSLAITAKVTGKLVYVAGSDTCHSEWPYNGAQQLTAIDLKG